MFEKIYKNLVIEKPTCMKTSQVTKLFKLAKASKTDIFPVFQNKLNIDREHQFFLQSQEKKEEVLRG